MKWTLVALVAAAVGYAAGVCAAEAPKQLGGFELGRHIENYVPQLKMETAFPVRFNEHLRQVEIQPGKWFKSGVITYGACARPGRITRIKLKYADSSRVFYAQLFERFVHRFGDPDEYRGDAFRVVIAWKWSFTDRQGNSISLILQHNTKDQDEKVGNAVKLTSWTAMEAEARCGAEKSFSDAGEPSKPPEPAGVDWQDLIPR